MQALNGKNLIGFGKFELDMGKKILRHDGEIIPLALKAAELLCVLVENQGEVVSNDELIRKVWRDVFVEDSVLTQNIYLLRKTLKSNGTKNSIRNVPRRGYVFDIPVTTDRDPILQNGQIAKNVEDATVESTVSFPRPVLVLSLVLVAVVLTASGYFYFRGDRKATTVAAMHPLKLKTVSVPSAVKTLSVLLLQSEDENFSKAFSNDLSVRLGSLNKFTVKPHYLVTEYRANGAELKTDFVLDGTVQMRNALFTADVRLLDTKANAEIWSGKFEYDNLIQLQDVVTNRTAKELLNVLSDAEREAVSKRLPSNLAAYQNFQTGYALWRNRKDGEAYFNKAIELDQSFARAHVGMPINDALTACGLLPWKSFRIKYRNTSKIQADAVANAAALSLFRACTRSIFRSSLSKKHRP